MERQKCARQQTEALLRAQQQQALTKEARARAEAEQAKRLVTKVGQEKR